MSGLRRFAGLEGDTMSEQEKDQTEVQKGAIVYDTEDSSELPSLAVVIHETGRLAEDYYISHLDKTVAEVNDDEYQNDAVVEVQFWPDFMQKSNKMYAYPIGRLEVVTDVWVWINENVPAGLREDMRGKYAGFVAYVNNRYNTYPKPNMYAPQRGGN